MTKGKAFEQQFRKDFKASVKDSFCYRLNDQTSGFKGTSRNCADFICYKKPYIYLIDCKTHAGISISFADFSQFDLMVEYAVTDGVKAGTVVWFYDKDIVIFIPISTWMKLQEDGKKSYSLKLIDDPAYPIIKLPSIKKRTFMTTDYNPMIEE